MAVLSQPLSTVVEPLPLSSRQQSDRTRSLTSASRTPATAERRPDGTRSPAPASHSRRHASSVSIGSVPRHQRTTSSILSRAAAALDRTHSAIASISEPVIRNRHSNSTLARLSLAAGSQQLRDEPASPDRPSAFDYPSSQSLPSNQGDGKHSATTSFSSAQHSPTQPSSGLSSDSPSPSKMHQTSSRLLRMTDDDRPFTRDFKDLFSTLIVSLLPLGSHRVRLTKVDYTFLSEDAINNLGSLKFSQSNRMPDPKDPSRIVTTTTTTTFSMAKDMARSICQRFVEARFIESADGKLQPLYSMKGSVWQLTAKGVAILDRFCGRNGIQQKQVAELVSLHCCSLVILEREQHSDKILSDRGTVEVIFRRFVGTDTRNVKPNALAADSDSLLDYEDGLTGVKMALERRVNGKMYKDTFTGKATSDWLVDCCTIVDKREAIEIASLFVEFELIDTVVQDRSYMLQNPGCHLFQPTRYSVYQISQRGRDVINGTSSRGRPSESEAGTGSQRNGVVRDSNTQRLEKILNDPALRLLFRENLRETHCEENLSFYKDVNDFVHSCKAAIRQVEAAPSSQSMDIIKETMAQAYGIYNAFLAPGSPCELNIDHQLRNNLATRMTKAVGQENGMVETLQEVTSLFENAQNAVFKLMASDSVPKFLRNAKYEQQLVNFNLDSSSRGVERSLSRSNRK
ncbi:regulator of g signaling pathway [Trichoderma cornu-damae]|uniref:Regulator of g signaling pathway n=1 Tax=Trichoderma cornu-damae TaxID=654480 RepID=A0A9P8TZ57_9HYPO|nr:regulator of g signaling pathway [Trichoderma cornu-damae]